MKRRQFLTTIIAASGLSCLKKEKIICLDKKILGKRLGSDGRGDFYLYGLPNSDKNIVLEINFRNKYAPGDSLKIILNDKFKYLYDNEKLPIYKIIEKIN